MATLIFFIVFWALLCLEIVLQDYWSVFRMRSFVQLHFLPWCFIFRFVHYHPLTFLQIALWLYLSYFVFYIAFLHDFRIFSWIFQVIGLGWRSGGVTIYFGPIRNTVSIHFYLFIFIFLFLWLFLWNLKFFWRFPWNWSLVQRFWCKDIDTLRCVYSFFSFLYLLFTSFFQIKMG